MSTRGIEGAPAGVAEAQKRPQSKVPPAWRKPLLGVHIGSTVSWLGSSLALSALGIAGLRGADPYSVYPAAHVLAGWLVAPLALLALGSGLLQAVLTPWGLTRYWWVTIKLAIAVVLAGLVLFLLVPGLSRVAQTLTVDGSRHVSDADRIRFAVAPTVASLLLAINVTLAIYRPRWRLR